LVGAVESIDFGGESPRERGNRCQANAFENPEGGE
jgi:hypothetical protein